MQTSKISTYLGFCLRARKIVFGAEEAEKQKRNVFLLIMDEGVGKSSQKSMLKAKENLGCPLVVAAPDALGQALHRPAVKAVAIQDKNLAEAILSIVESDPQFKFYSGGNN